jgi:hypothetical protein
VGQKMKVDLNLQKILQETIKEKGVCGEILK